MCAVNSLGALTKLRSEVLKTVKLSDVVFWALTQSNVVGGYRRFGVKYHTPISIKIKVLK
jgi:hypothetical protein